ncbi:M36 family metallopeptidase [Streptosporangium vulgare]|uniref:M36 family metallopeptidase n=1 Tax=Streptosporangium vulgare TaxID=46190 RepID=UPI0031E0B4DB
MHDWSYRLGFTETAWNMQNDNGERGGLAATRAGQRPGGRPVLSVRDNANQITGPDGVAPITNMYMWQPIAGSFYSPCVDGDYDMSVIGHEYTHGDLRPHDRRPERRWSGAPGRGDEREHLRPVRDGVPSPSTASAPRATPVRHPAATSPATRRRGIRNYDMSDSPLTTATIALRHRRPAGARRR